MIKKLIVHPTARRLRELQEEFRVNSGILPTLMLTNEFEDRSVIIKDRFQVDSMERILLLREAASFDRFLELNLNLDLVKFFTKSDAIFKFFEELSREKVSLSELSRVDTYAQFDEHLHILQILKKRYVDILDQKGLVDRAILPEIYEINRSFIASFDEIELHIEGLLSRYEFELIGKVSRITQTIIHFQTSKFTKKMIDRFGEFGIDLPRDSLVIIDFSSKEIISSTPISSNLNTKVIATQYRFEQIAIAFEQIELMVQSGIEPSNIALILPDESLKDAVEMYDKNNNLNFAMGTSYTKTKSYKSLAALEQYLRDKSMINMQRVKRFGIDYSSIEGLNQKIKATQFFQTIDELNCLDCSLDREDDSKENPKISEQYRHISVIFEDFELYFGEWLTIWQSAVMQISKDDNRGGKVTVLGALETRGALFDGVVVVDFNDGITPAVPAKDMFLNSSVRASASLPTIKDREDLQKQLYKRVLEQSKSSVVIYCTNDDKLPSKFLYELGLNRYVTDSGDMKLLYPQAKLSTEDIDPLVSNFDAKKIIWSSSRLKTYLTCKRKYYYRYIKAIKQKDELEQNDGTILHKVVENIFAQKNSYLSKEELWRSISIELERLLDDTKIEAKYKKLLWSKELESFISNQIKHFESGWQVVQKEYEVNGVISELNFTGKIDRLDQNSMQTMVIDYKSGKVNNREKEIENEVDFQMSIYANLLANRYQNLSFGFLPFFDSDKSTGGVAEELKAVEEKNEHLLAHIERLKATSEFEATKCEDLSQCRYCEYALMCGRGEYL